MSFASRRSAAVAAAALAVAGAGAALVADPGRAQDAGTTYTITYGKSDGAVNDVAPKGIGRGRASVGDQFFITNAIRRTTACAAGSRRPTSSVRRRSGS